MLLPKWLMLLPLFCRMYCITMVADVIDVHLKGGHTIKDHLMAPKDKDPLLKKSGGHIQV